MRRRLLLSALGVAAVAIFVLGVPLLIVTVRLIGDAARNDLLRETQNVQGYLSSHPGDAADRDALDRLVGRGRQLTISQRGNPTLQLGEPSGAHAIVQSETVRGGPTVTVSEPLGDVRSTQIRAGLVIAGLALVAAVAAALVARYSARRLSVPLLQVADRAADLGAGNFHTSSRRYAIPELDRICAVLDHSAEEIAALVQRERDLASDVSHQLRTRLAALQIRIEEIALCDDPVVRAEAAAALEQAERLSGVIDELLVHARHARAAGAEQIEVGREIATIVDEQRPALDRVKRTVSVRCEPGLVARATPGRLHQVVSGLVDNAIGHGAGTVEVSAWTTLRNVVIEVTDEGPGVAPDLVPRLFDRGVSGSGGTGLGLALARALVEADGGRLELRHACPPVFAIFLPRADRS